MTDRFVRISTALVVVAIGLVAAVVSYRHALEVVRAHGETGVTAQLVPLTVDGLVYVASMVLLDAARRRVQAPALARLALALGIAATVAVNVLHGIAHGVVGALIAAWPAVCLVLTVELLMAMIRTGRTANETPLDLPELDDAEPWPDDRPVGAELWETVPAIESAPEVLASMLPDGGDREVLTAETPGGKDAVTGRPAADLAPVVATARERFRETLATRGVPSVRALRRELRIGHPRAVRVRAALESESATESAPALF